MSFTLKKNHRCGKTVYFAEKQSYDGKDFHGICLQAFKKTQKSAVSGYVEYYRNNLIITIWIVHRKKRLINLQDADGLQLLSAEGSRGILFRYDSMSDRQPD